MNFDSYKNKVLEIMQLSRLIRECATEAKTCAETTEH